LQKLPVFATAARAYRFMLRESETILRLSWFPFLVLSLVEYFANRAQSAAIRSAMERADAQSTAGLSAILLWQIPVLVGTVTVISMVAVALYRVILFGERQEGRHVYFAFGVTERRFALLLTAMLLPSALWAIVSVGFVDAMGSDDKTGIRSSVLIVALVLFLALFFVMIRLAPVFAITVLDNRYDFKQAWSLTRGNFWRFVAVLMLAAIPVAVATNIVVFLLGSYGSEPFESALLVQAIMGFVWSIVYVALGVAIVSYSYKALSGRQLDEILVADIPR
jgi:hypothetical protein